MKFFRDILLLLSVTGLLGAAGCAGFIYDNYPTGDDSEDSDMVTLVLNVGMVSPTRAGTDDREKMHDLRIVLLDNDGKVEYNRHIVFNTALTEYKEGTQGFQFIRTKPGSKKIFFVANEIGVNPVQLTDRYGGTDRATLSGQSLTAVLDSRPAVSPDATGPVSTDFEDLVKSVYFAPGDYSGMKIPLSSSYEFEIPDEKAGERVVKEFYLVHAATKFEFLFVNHRLAPIQINDLSVSSIADNMYLMAHFEGEKGESVEPEDKKMTWTDEAGQKTGNWIDWLKAVSDATNKNPFDLQNETVNASYGWIKDYVLPSGCTHSPKNIIPSNSDKDKYVIEVTNNDANPYNKVPIVYYPESKSGDAQSYSFTISLTDTALSNDTKTFTEPLTISNGGSVENLVTLFRNTHVRVTCIIGYDQRDISLRLQIGICPWNTEEINIPAFD